MPQAQYIIVLDSGLARHSDVNVAIAHCERALADPPLLARADASARYLVCRVVHEVFARVETQRLSHTEG